MENSTVARPYAKAAFAYAVEQQQLAHWYKMLGTLAFIVSDERVQLQLKNPTLSKEQRTDLLSSIADDSLDDHGKNFISVMSKQGRLVILIEVFKQFEILKAEHENSKDVKVLTAYPMSDSELDALKKKLSQYFSSNVDVTVEIDKGLIGGLVIKSDDVVIDGSIRGKLNKLAESLGV